MTWSASWHTPEISENQGNMIDDFLMQEYRPRTGDRRANCLQHGQEGLWLQRRVRSLAIDLKHNLVPGKERRERGDPIAGNPAENRAAAAGVLILGQKGENENI
ncbi:MAG: hypothetical protein HY315_07835 [Acidobacteria bacterium]|nr:hypothetical protein [Acidobacteriota bacterium]